MNRYKMLQAIQEAGLIAILRAPQGDVVELAKALVAGGVRALEVTADTPGFNDEIARLRKEVPEALVGVGTVFDAETARAAMLAGAQFTITPVLCRDTIELAVRYDHLVVPGTLTPTEMFQAFQWGAPAVKLFPASSLGPDYIRHVRGPLGQIPIIPTGGIDLSNVGDFIAAGAAAVGLGGSLVKRTDGVDGNYAVVTERAKAFVEAVAAARQAKGK